MNTAQKSSYDRTGQRGRSTKQLGLSNEKGNKTLCFKDFGMEFIEAACITDDSGEHWIPTYKRKGLLTMDEALNSFEAIEKFIKKPENTLKLFVRILEIDNYLKNKQNG